MHQLQEPQKPGGQRLLSARQVQTMLRVDRSTVYRMAEDGRLPAVKVGRQWRFPADRIAAVLRAEAPGTGPAPRPAPRPEPEAISLEAASSVAQVAAELLGVMMVVTDMDGRPLTDVANPCRWFARRSDDPQLLSACTREWQQLADDPDFEPRFAVGALGFECARAFVRRGTSLVGMVLVGGIAPVGCDDPNLHQLDADQRRAVLAALPKVAGSLSRVAPRRAGSNAEQEQAE